MMSSISSPQQQFDLVTRRLTEVNGGDLIKDLFAAGKVPKCLWACAPTGKPHIAYFLPFLKLVEFVKAGVDVTVFFADLYAFCVNYKDSLETVAWRTQWYHFMCTAVLESLGAPVGKIHFVDGSSYDLTKEVVIQNYQLAALCDQQDIKNVGDEFHSSKKLSVMLCPGMMALAEEYLDIDFQFGGEDQRGLFTLNERFLPLMGYRKRAHMMNAMMPGLCGPKMSASVPDSKIDFLDSPEAVRTKIEGAACDRVVVGNGILSLLKEVLFPIRQFRAEERIQSFGNEDVNGDRAFFSVPIDTQTGPVLKQYGSYEEVERAFLSGVVDTGALKHAVTDAINELLSPLRSIYDGNEEWQRVDKLAYPDGG